MAGKIKHIHRHKHTHRIRRGCIPGCLLSLLLLSYYAVKSLVAKK